MPATRRTATVRQHQRQQSHSDPCGEVSSPSAVVASVGSRQPSTTRSCPLLMRCQRRWENVRGAGTLAANNATKIGSARKDGHPPSGTTNLLAHWRAGPHTREGENAVTLGGLAASGAGSGCQRLLSSRRLRQLVAQPLQATACCTGDKPPTTPTSRCHELPVEPGQSARRQQRVTQHVRGHDDADHGRPSNASSPGRLRHLRESHDRAVRPNDGNNHHLFHGGLFSTCRQRQRRPGDWRRRQHTPLQHGNNKQKGERHASFCRRGRKARGNCTTKRKVCRPGPEPPGSLS